MPAEHESLGTCDEKPFFPVRAQGPVGLPVIAARLSGCDRRPQRVRVPVSVQVLTHRSAHSFQ